MDNSLRIFTGDFAKRLPDEEVDTAYGTKRVAKMLILLEKMMMKECNVVLVRILFNFFCISMAFLMKIALLTKMGLLSIMILIVSIVFLMMLLKNLIIGVKFI